MNANGLAQQLSQMDTLQEVMSKFEYSIIQNSATMLRQQQEKLTKYELRHQAQRDRIAILEAQLKKSIEK